MKASRVPSGIPTGGQFAASERGEATADLAEDGPAQVTCPRHGGPWGGDETCEFCVDDFGDARPVPEPITDDERDELAELEAHFEASGGRGVELAERIDELRAKELMADDGGPAVKAPWDVPEGFDTFEVVQTIPGPHGDQRHHFGIGHSATLPDGTKLTVRRGDHGTYTAAGYYLEATDTRGRELWGQRFTNMHAALAAGSDELRKRTPTKPHGHGLPWNEDIDRRRRLELEFAEQLAGTTWGKTDPRQLARRVYEGVAHYRGIPLDAAERGSAEAIERGDDMLRELEEVGPAVAADRGRVAYDAITPIVDAVQERRFQPTGFVSEREPGPSGYTDAPTKSEVDRAKAYLDRLEMPRPMYRGDWERIDGGRGPTVAQVRADAEYRSVAMLRIADARREYEELKAAWEAAGSPDDLDV